MGDRHYSSHEVAEEMEISQRRLQQLAKEQEVGRMVSNRYRFTCDDVVELMVAHGRLRRRLEEHGRRLGLANRGIRRKQR